MAIRTERPIPPKAARVLEVELTGTGASLAPGGDAVPLTIEDPDLIGQDVDDVEGAVGGDGNAGECALPLLAERDLAHELSQDW
jgi:hypothetical protein